MAQELDDGEFWLPPQFLTDDDILMDFKPTKKTDSNGAGEKLFGLVGPFGPNSDLNSPVESVMGSTETESDEEDYLVGMTRKMDDLWRVDYTKSWGMATSPQSTLCSVMGACDCKQGSSRGSPNCPSPPANAGVVKSDAAWDLLYAAAGEVARMKMAEQGHGFISNRGYLGPSRKPSPISVPNKVHTPNIGVFNTKQNLSYHQLQALQFQQLKQQLMLKQQHQQYTHQQLVQNRARILPTNKRPLQSSPSAWPTLQQSHGGLAAQIQQTMPQPPPGTGMRAVFLGNPGGGKRECAGTGVFLPRQGGAQTESRRKRGCSTVLLPDRVVQALNLNLDATMDAHSQFQPKTFTPDYEAEMRYRNVLMGQQQQQQRRNVLRQQPMSPISNELRLPQEWTY